ncbi:MAG: response regulator [Synergistaceae bacterium]|jgi:CheY-like chemotaxis protein/DNA-binding CsgD family transcriptional regulator|nr:response regulator [Synergistaceae bacterium]
MLFDKYFDKNLNLRARLFNSFGFTGAVIGALVAASSSVTGAGLLNVILNLSASLCAVFLIEYANRTGQFERCYNITVVVVFFILFAALYFSAGGYHGGTPSFFVFSVTFTAMMFRGKKRTALVASEIVFYCALCLIQYFMPGLVSPFPSEWSVATDIATGFVGASLALVFAMAASFQAYDSQTKKLEAARLEAETSRLKAEAANEAKTAFLANMSHEIRTPLNDILGLNEIISRYAEPGQIKITEGAADIKESGESLKNLIGDLLDMSKLVSGGQEIASDDYNVSRLIRALSVTGETETRKRGLQFTANAAPDIPSVLRGDYERVKQIAANFLTNAAKYTERGGVTMSVNFIRESGDEAGSGGVLRLSVTDTGIGIKSEDRGRIFEKFSRIDQTEPAGYGIEGAGLGLAIAKELATLMCGDITVDSVYGIGSTFTASIPQGVSDAAPMGEFEQEKTRPAEDSVLTRTASGCRVLVVDDNPKNQRVVRNLLSGTLLSVDSAMNGSACLDMVKRAKDAGDSYHVILMDYMMPGMDGMETFDLLGEAIPGFDIPVIALTADALFGVSEMFIDAGFADYLSKPVSKRDLEDAIFAFLPPDRITFATQTESIGGRGKKPSFHTEEYLASKRELSNQGISLYEGMKYASGNIMRFRENVRVFMEQSEGARSEIEKRADALDWTALSFLLHSLKNMTATLGAVDLNASAAKAERICRGMTETDEEMEKLLRYAMPMMYLEWGTTCKGFKSFLGRTGYLERGVDHEAQKENAEKTHKVLVIDDDEAMLELVRAQLARQYEVITANGGERALRVMKEENPDIILLDIEMPGMDGWETLDRIEDNPATADIPVIFLTGRSDSDDRIKGMDAGASDYITKPFERDILLANIRRRLASAMRLRSMLEAQKNGAVLELDGKKFEELTSKLNENDKEIARLMALGGTNRSIAAKLNYAPGTIKNKATQITNELGVKDRFELRELVLKVKQP